MNWSLKLKVLLSMGKRTRQTNGTAAPISFRTFFIQYFLGFNKSCYWPVHLSSKVLGSEHIYIGEGTAPGLSHGCYIFASEEGKIRIGKYTIIAPNVCIAGFNHRLTDYTVTETNGPLTIGDYCWIGANAVVLPNVELGNHTVVAAGAVVTKSFPKGYCVIGGNPASVIKEIPMEECVERKNEFDYHGYLTQSEFKNYFDQVKND
jgi:acetyltransferase-like isoleucine patch superfamily enzyme